MPLIMMTKDPFHSTWLVCLLQISGLFLEDIIQGKNQKDYI